MIAANSELKATLEASPPPPTPVLHPPLDGEASEGASPLAESLRRGHRRFGSAREGFSHRQLVAPIGARTTSISNGAPGQFYVARCWRSASDRVRWRNRGGGVGCASESPAAFVVVAALACPCCCCCCWSAWSSLATTPSPISFSGEPSLTRLPSCVGSPPASRAPRAPWAGTRGSACWSPGTRGASSSCGVGRRARARPARGIR